MRGAAWLRRRAARTLSAASLLLFVAGAFGACKREPDYTAARARLKAQVLAAPPASMTKLDVDFDGKLRLLGFELDPPAPRRGKHVKLTLYWRADQKIEKDWKLFTHLLDGSGERMMNLDDLGPLRESHDGQPALPPAGFELGKVYADPLSFTLPLSVKTLKIQFVAGLFRNDERMKILSGPQDEPGRAVVTRVSVERRPPRGPRPEALPTLRSDKLEPGTKIAIDGKLDEPAWQTAPEAVLVDVGTGEQNVSFPVNGKLRLLWSDPGFYVGFEVQDPDVVGGFKKGSKDPHLWLRDTIEMIIDPDGDGDNKDYYEIQINPQNLVFDSQFDSYNQPRTEPDGPFGHQDWSAELKSAVTIQGSLDRSDDRDQGYVVEALVPWKSFGKAQRSPPAIGDVWRMNFYAIQGNAGVAWSPIRNEGNFHKASRFGRVMWAETGYSAAPRHGELGVEGGPGVSPELLKRFNAPKLAAPRHAPGARGVGAKAEDTTAEAAD